MAIEVIGTIKPKNGAKFPIVEDVDVSVTVRTNEKVNMTAIAGNTTRYSQVVANSLTAPETGGAYRINKVGTKAAANATVRFLLCEVTRKEDNTAVLKQVAVLGDAVADSDGLAILEFDGGYLTELSCSAVVACAGESVLQAFTSSGLSFDNFLCISDGNYYDSENGAEFSGYYTSNEDGTADGALMPIALFNYDLLKTMTLSDFANNVTENHGKSAYEVAVDNGFEGTEEEWLESLQGAAGPAGADGKTPVKGEDYFTDADKQEMVEAVLEAMPEDEDGVSSWNDLTDKPFYEEGSTEVILEEKDISGFVSGQTSFECSGELIVGETYAVHWNGTEHECVSFEMEGGVVIGNVAFAGGADTGEPFVIGYIEGSWFCYALIYVEAEDAWIPNATVDTHKVGISHNSVTIKPLDAKYLPSAIAIDLSAYESDGKIVETYADGSVVTTVMEFDSNGKPTKITDSNGNVTVLTW